MLYGGKTIGVNEVGYNFFKKRKISVGEDVEKLEPSYAAGRNVKWCSCCGKEYGVSPKRRAWNYPMIQQFYS